MKIRKSRTGLLHLSGGPAAANCSAGNRGMRFVGEVGFEAAKLLPEAVFCRKCFGGNPIARIDRIFSAACDPFVHEHLTHEHLTCALCDKMVRPSTVKVSTPETGLFDGSWVECPVTHRPVEVAGMRYHPGEKYYYCPECYDERFNAAYDDRRAPAPKPIREGRKLFGQGVDASGIEWAVYRACDLPADDREAAELLELGACYGGVGAYFQHAPNFRRVRGHVLVTISFGYDC